jgi:hypothetical protein
MLNVSYFSRYDAICQKARYITLKDHRFSTLFFYPIGQIGSSFFLMKKEVVALCLARYFFLVPK